MCDEQVTTLAMMASFIENGSIVYTTKMMNKKNDTWGRDWISRSVCVYVCVCVQLEIHDNSISKICSHRSESFGGIPN